MIEAASKDGQPKNARLALIALFAFLVIVAVMPIYHSCGSGPAGANGLTGKYYRNAGWEGEPVETRVDAAIDFDWSRSLPMPPPFSVEWSGKIFIEQSGGYTFALIADDGASLEIDGQMIIDATKVLLEKKSGTVTLAPGAHSIRVRYFNLLFGGSIRVFWTPYGKPEQILTGDELHPV